MDFMEIFYINKNSFETNAALITDQSSSLTPITDISFKSEKRKIEYALGRFILNLALKNFYNKENFDIVIKNDKPCLKDNFIYFSISHSYDIVAICFDFKPVGFDIEHIKERNLQKISKRYKRDFADLKSFYNFWTEYEAKYKLQSLSKETKTFDFLNDYIATIASVRTFLDIKIFNIDKNCNFKQRY